MRLQNRTVKICHRVHTEDIKIFSTGQIRVHTGVPGGRWPVDGGLHEEAISDIRANNFRTPGKM